MNVRIDIRTPAGQSLEGFPKEVNNVVSTDKFVPIKDAVWANHLLGEASSLCNRLKLHPKDKIIIEVLP